PQPFGVACARKKNTGKMPVIRRDKCLCYCRDGQDAHNKKVPVQANIRIAMRYSYNMQLRQKAAGESGIGIN
ncbi:MAG: hypothetical protein WCP55_22205, partial [Lentisphaerota bacterium]